MGVPRRCKEHGEKVLFLKKHAFILFKVNKVKYKRKKNAYDIKLGGFHACLHNIRFIVQIKNHARRLF